MAIANDVNFEEDDNESTPGGGKAKSVADEKEKEVKEKEEPIEKPNEEPSTSKTEPKATRHRSPSSKDIDYKCIHCEMFLSTANVRKLFLIN